MTHRFPSVTWMVFLLSVLWWAAIAAPPALHAGGYHTGAALLRLSFHPICHQIPARSFSFGDHPLAVCARCTGIYGGFLIGCLAALVTTRRRAAACKPAGGTLLVVAAVPTALQWSLSRVEWIPDLALHRAVLGSLLGFAGAFQLLPALHGLAGEVADRRKRRSLSKGTIHVGST
ncbi:MAG: DUF2085 domain-containing protein [Acidobacteriota bacterium]